MQGQGNLNSIALINMSGSIGKTSSSTGEERHQENINMLNTICFTFHSILGFGCKLNFFHGEELLKSVLLF
jgi:hypothetical protein